MHAGTAGNVRWLVDPLDGTTNFAHNYPFFAVSIAAEVGGRLTAAAVYDPVRDEMFDAAAGEGATLNGRPIRVTDVDRLEDALLVTGFPYSIREDPEPTLRLFRAFLVRAQGIRRDGSAALNLCYLACGRFDGFWETRPVAVGHGRGRPDRARSRQTATDWDWVRFRLEGRRSALHGDVRLRPVRGVAGVVS